MTQDTPIPKLLIIEDEPLQRQTLMEIFGEEGFHAIGAGTAEEGVGYLATEDSLCAAIVDLRLPDAQGADLLERLQVYADDVPMVINTAYASYESVKDAINIGAFAYVEKARDPDELVHHVHRAVHRHLQRYAKHLEQTVSERTQTLQQANKKLSESERQLKALVSELTLTEERLKRSIATEMHDEISQSLAISRMKVGALSESVTDASVRKTLQEVYRELEHALHETRTLTSRLSYPTLGLLGFERAIAEWLAEEVQAKHRIETEFHDDGQAKPLEEDMRAVLFRTVRELLTNAVKHSQAGRIAVAITRRDNSMVVTVSDDGIGCDPDRMSAQTKGFGLLSAQESLARLGGGFSVESRPGHGCRVTVTAPLGGQDIR